jgi:hypothetical protein
MQWGEALNSISQVVGATAALVGPAVLIALIGGVPEPCGVQRVKPRDKYSRYGYACRDSAF